MIAALARLAYRLPLVVLWTTLMHCYLRARMILHIRPWNQKRPCDVIGRWGAGLGRIMGLQLTYRNQRTGPMGDLIVANHMGFLDIPALLTVFPAVFVIKVELRNMFILGRGLANQGHVFVDRANRSSRRNAGRGAAEVLANDDRLIVFPEGRASPGSKRLPFKPFMFEEAVRQNKLVELCVLDYMPDRSALEWDINKPTIPQLIKLFGRNKTQVSLEFFPAEVPESGAEMARRCHELAETRLRLYDEERAASLASHAPATPASALDSSS